jgi:hypothetical protein
MKLLLIILFLFLLFFPSIYAKNYGVALDPTEMFVHLSSQINKVEVRLKVWNPSETDNNYTIRIPAELKDFMRWDCSDEWNNSEYWCENKGYFVPAGTQKNQSTTIKLLFLKRNDQEANNTYFLYLYPNPQSLSTGQVAVLPRAEIKLHLSQIIPATITTSTITTSQYPQSLDNPPLNIPQNIRDLIFGKQTTTTTTRISNGTELNHTEITTATSEQQKKSFSISIFYYILVIAIVVVIGVWLFLKWYY